MARRSLQRMARDLSSPCSCSEAGRGAERRGRRGRLRSTSSGVPMLLARSALLSPALTLAAPVGMSTSAQVATAEAAEAKIFTAAGRRRRGRRTVRSSSTRRRPGAPPARRRSRFCPSCRRSRIHEARDLPGRLRQPEGRAHDAGRADPEHADLLQGRPVHRVTNKTAIEDQLNKSI